MSNKSNDKHMYHTFRYDNNSIISTNVIQTFTHVYKICHVSTFIIYIMFSLLYNNRTFT